MNAEAKALAKVARGLASLDVATTLARVALAHVCCRCRFASTTMPVPGC